VGYAFLSGSPHSASIPSAAADHEATHAGPSRTPDHPATVAPTVRPTVPARTLTGPAATVRPTTVPARTLTGPAATVRAFVAASNGHDYARAWDLGGRNTGWSYPSFVSGFSTTARDTLTIESVSGDVVTARLTAKQTDGTIDSYDGTYTVDSGVIIGFDVLQVG